MNFLDQTPKKFIVAIATTILCVLSICTFLVCGSSSWFITFITPPITQPQIVEVRLTPTKSIRPGRYSDEPTQVVYTVEPGRFPATRTPKSTSTSIPAPTIVPTLLSSIESPTLTGVTISTSSPKTPASPQTSTPTPSPTNAPTEVTPLPSNTPPIASPSTNTPDPLPSPIRTPIEITPILSSTPLPTSSPTGTPVLPPSPTHTLTPLTPTFTTIPTLPPSPTTTPIPNTSTPMPTNSPVATSTPDYLMTCQKYSPSRREIECRGDVQVCDEGIAACEIAFSQDPNNFDGLNTLTFLRAGRTGWNPPPSLSEDIEGIIEHHDDIMRFGQDKRGCDMLVRLGEAYRLKDPPDEENAKRPLETYLANDCNTLNERVECNLRGEEVVVCRNKK